MTDRAIHKQPAQQDRKPPIVFVHGVYHAAWCWDEYFTSYFSQADYEVYTLNLRGHGADSSNLTWASFNDYVNDLTKLITQLDRPPILIGHSMGGMIIQRYIQDHRAAAAVLISTPTAKSLRRASWRMFKRRPSAVLKSILTLNTDDIYHDPNVIRSSFFTNKLPSNKAQKFINLIQNQPESRRILLDLMCLKPKKPAQQPPILVIGGGKDQDLPTSTFFDVAKIYNTQPIILKNMPHDMMLEDDWQRAADIVLEWLA